MLHSGSRITGTILGDDGQPLPRAWVIAKRGKQRVASARANGEGRFSLNVPRGEELDIEFLGVDTNGAIEAGIRSGRVTGVSAGTSGVVLRVHRLDTDRTLRVRVVEPDGTPAAGILVFVGRERATTNDEGVAEFTGLTAKQTGVGAHPGRRRDVLWPEIRNVVPAGQEVTLALRAVATISGIVLMPDGTPARGAQVKVIDNNRARYYAGTDAEGHFAALVPADEPGPWRVQVERRGKGLKGEATDVRTGATGLRIQLE